MEWAWRIAVEAIDLVGEDDPTGTFRGCGPLHEADEVPARAVLDKRPRQQRDYLRALLIDEAGGPSGRSGNRDEGACHAVEAYRHPDAGENNSEPRVGQVCREHGLWLSAPAIQGFPRCLPVSRDPGAARCAVVGECRLHDCKTAAFAGEGERVVTVKRHPLDISRIWCAIDSCVVKLV